MSLLRVAARGTTTSRFLRPATASLLLARHGTAAAASAFLLANSALLAGFATSSARRSEHKEESFDEFTARFEKEFDAAQDVFELQRNLNNVFAYDLVPSPTVIAAALRAARRVNDFPTAVRIFEGVKCKVDNRSQYDQYLEGLSHLRAEYGVPLKEEMYPDDPKNWKTMT